MLPLSVQINRDLSDLSWIVAARSFGFILTVILFGVIFQSATQNSSECLLAIGYLLPAAGFFFVFYFMQEQIQSIFFVCEILPSISNRSNPLLNIVMVSMFGIIFPRHVTRHF